VNEEFTDVCPRCFAPMGLDGIVYTVIRWVLCKACKAAKK